MAPQIALLEDPGIDGRFLANGKDGAVVGTAIAAEKDLRDLVFLNEVPEKRGPGREGIAVAKTISLMVKMGVSSIEVNLPDFSVAVLLKKFRPSVEKRPYRPLQQERVPHEVRRKYP
jgi:hypothetical protein